jgi:ComF family protein
VLATEGKPLSTFLEVFGVYKGTWRRRDVLLGSLCPVCQNPCIAPRFCGPCAADLPRRRKLALNRKIVGIKGAYAAFDYAFPLAGLVQRAKFKRDLATLNCLAGLFSELIVGELPELDVVSPIPLPAFRYLHRGYNQSVSLAADIAARCERPLLPNSLRARGYRPPQSVLSAEARQQNVLDSFRATRNLQGLRVLLVDDVITTGATMSAAAKALRAAGARDVFGAALAATR